MTLGNTKPCHRGCHHTKIKNVLAVEQARKKTRPSKPTENYTNLDVQTDGRRFETVRPFPSLPPLLSCFCFRTENLEHFTSSPLLNTLVFPSAPIIQSSRPTKNPNRVRLTHQPPSTSRYRQSVGARESIKNLSRRRRRLTVTTRAHSGDTNREQGQKQADGCDESLTSNRR